MGCGDFTSAECADIAKMCLKKMVNVINKLLLIRPIEREMVLCDLGHDLKLAT